MVTVFSDAVIEGFCSKAPFIESKDDLNGILLLRPEHHESVSCDMAIVSSAPPPSKKHQISDCFIYNINNSMLIVY